MDPLESLRQVAKLLEDAECVCGHLKSAHRRHRTTGEQCDFCDCYRSYEPAYPRLIKWAAQIREAIAAIEAERGSTRGWRQANRVKALIREGK